MDQLDDGVGLVFNHPATIIIAGPTKCGKTHFVKKVFDYDMLYPKPARTVVAYSEWQPLYDEWHFKYPQIDFIKGYPEGLYDTFSSDTKNLLVLDDQMHDAGKRQELGDLFTQGSHHKNLSVVFIVQNIYDKGKSMRNANMNSGYLVLFPTLRDNDYFTHLGRQMYPNSIHIIGDALRSLRDEKPRSYLVIDLDAQQKGWTMMRSGIFPDEELVFFVPRNEVKTGPQYQFGGEGELDWRQLVTLQPL